MRFWCQNHKLNWACRLIRHCKSSKYLSFVWWLYNPIMYMAFAFRSYPLVLIFFSFSKAILLLKKWCLTWTLRLYFRVRYLLEAVVSHKHIKHLNTRNIFLFLTWISLRSSQIFSASKYMIHTCRLSPPGTGWSQ